MARERLETKRRRTEEIIRRLEHAYPESGISLEFGSEFQLLVAVVLSAQCTDAMVNRVTSSLFRRYRTVRDFAEADAVQLERSIRPTGYYHQKTKNIIAAAVMVRDRFGGRLPKTMEALLELPGVGRKTANVLLWNAFERSEGIAVDTHVTRLSRLLRLSTRADPARIEADLLRLVPAASRGHLTHLIIDHGRAVCVARRPRCERCVLNDLCPSARRPLEHDRVPSPPPPSRPARGRP